MEVSTLREELLREAGKRWFDGDEIESVLTAPEMYSLNLSNVPPISPAHGQLYLFDKEKTKYFKRDGVDWLRKKSNRPQETYQTIKVKGEDRIHGVYCRSTSNNNFQKRIYTLFTTSSTLVFVHYRDISVRSQDSTRSLNLPSTRSDQQLIVDFSPECVRCHESCKLILITQSPVFLAQTNTTPASVTSASSSSTTSHFSFPPQQQQQLQQQVECMVMFGEALRVSGNVISPYAVRCYTPTFSLPAGATWRAQIRVLSLDGRELTRSLTMFTFIAPENPQPNQLHLPAENYPASQHIAPTVPPMPTKSNNNPGFIRPSTNFPFPSNPNSNPLHHHPTPGAPASSASSTTASDAGDDCWESDDDDVSETAVDDLPQDDLEGLVNNYLMTVVKRLVMLASSDEELNSELRSLDENGYSLLHYCSMFNLTALVPILIAKGADANQCTGDGSTPLHLCASAGHLLVAQILVASGAKVLAVDAQQRTPLDIASHAGHEVVVRFLSEILSNEAAARSGLHIDTMLDDIISCSHDQPSRLSSLPSLPLTKNDTAVTLENKQPRLSGPEIPIDPWENSAQANGQKNGGVEGSDDVHISALLRGFHRIDRSQTQGGALPGSNLTGTLPVKPNSGESSFPNKLLHDAISSLSLADKCALALCISQHKPTDNNNNNSSNSNSGTASKRNSAPRSTHTEALARQMLSLPTSPVDAASSVATNEAARSSGNTVLGLADIARFNFSLGGDRSTNLSFPPLIDTSAEHESTFGLPRSDLSVAKTSHSNNKSGPPPVVPPLFLTRPEHPRHDEDGDDDRPETGRSNHSSLSDIEYEGLDSSLSETEKRSLDVVLRMMGDVELQKVDEEVKLIENNVRGWLLRKNYANLRKAAKTLQLAWRERLSTTASGDVTTGTLSQPPRRSSSGGGATTIAIGVHDANNTSTLGRKRSFTDQSGDNNMDLSKLASTSHVEPIQEQFSSAIKTSVSFGDDDFDSMMDMILSLGDDEMLPLPALPPYGHHQFSTAPESSRVSEGILTQLPGTFQSRAEQSSPLILGNDGNEEAQDGRDASSRAAATLQAATRGMLARKAFIGLRRQAVASMVIQNSLKQWWAQQKDSNTNGAS